MREINEGKAKQGNGPFLKLVLSEHSGKSLQTCLVALPGALRLALAPHPANRRDLPVLRH